MHFPWLERFFWTGVKAVNQTLVLTKQPERDRLKRWISVRFQAWTPMLFVCGVNMILDNRNVISARIQELNYKYFHLLTMQ